MAILLLIAIQLLIPEMMMNILNSLFGTYRSWAERQDTMLAPVVTAKASRSEKYESDIRAITSKWGLRPGLCIETTLQELLTIAPRHRPRIDAYNGLVSELWFKYGVTLTIKSRKTKK